MISQVKLQKAFNNYRKSNPHEFIKCEWDNSSVGMGINGVYTIHNNGYGKTYWRIVFTDFGNITRAVGPIPTCFIEVVLNTKDHKVINQWRIKMVNERIKFNKDEIKTTKKSAKSSIDSFQKQIKGLVCRRNEIGRRN